MTAVVTGIFIIMFNIIINTVGCSMAWNPKKD